MSSEKILRVLVIALGLMFLWRTASFAQDEPPAGAPPEMPAPRLVPGINSDDPFPDACVDCHINYVDMGMDTRLSTILANWSVAVEPEILAIAQLVAGPAAVLAGRHPKLPVQRMDIPGDCLVCHESGTEDVVPLAAFLHKVHLLGGDTSVYMRVFQGECTYCHKLDSTTGSWRVPDGTENP